MAELACRFGIEMVWLTSTNNTDTVEKVYTNFYGTESNHFPFKIKKENMEKNVGNKYRWDGSTRISSSSMD